MVGHQSAVKWLSRGYDMPTYEIPGQGKLGLSTLVLDLNGTAALGGGIVPGAAAALDLLLKPQRLIATLRR